MTPEQLSERSRKSAAARWKKETESPEYQAAILARIDKLRAKLPASSQEQLA